MMEGPLNECLAEQRNQGTLSFPFTFTTRTDLLQFILESALMRPQNRWSYAPDSSIFEIAAAYGYGLAKNHPFVDGNRRTALISILLFLELNGYGLSASQEQRY